MKIVVLNGSPKGMTSVTMQYVLFLGKKFPEHEFRILHVCQELHRLEDQPAAFEEVIQAVRAADGILWGFPLYYLLVHGYYKRFIELVFKRAPEAFQGKPAAALSTSIRYFDHTAHNYIHAVCDDLGMKFFGSFSAEMYDLLQETEQKRLLQFGADFLEAIRTAPSLPRVFRPVERLPFTYTPGPTSLQMSTSGRKTLVVSDHRGDASNLSHMVNRFCSCFTDPVEVINLWEIKVRGGCLGCCQCGMDNVCVYQDADDVVPTYRKMMAADLLILAGEVQDRYLSARWKLFFDRGFFHNHVPMFPHKQMGYLISGPLMQVPNLRQILECYVQNQPANLVGIVTDEVGDSGQLDRLLESLAQGLLHGAATGYVQPPNFFGVAGGKLFRDAIYASLRLVFQADHRYFKSHGLYDFPRRSLRTRISEGFLNLMLKIPSFQREFRKRFKEEMVKPLARVLERA